MSASRYTTKHGIFFTEEPAIELDEAHPLASTSDRDRHPHALPPFDKALSTRNACVAAVCLSYVIGLVCLGLSIYVYNSSGATTDPDNESDQTTWMVKIASMPSAAREVVSLVLNIAVTILTESLAYVHATSLRWTLWKRGRLDYCSNLRLFSHAERSAANSRFGNAVFTFGLVITYTAASQTILNGILQYDSTQGVTASFVNGFALLSMGVGLILQAIIAHICFRNASSKILTWSSNPLTITLAAVQTGSRVEHRNGRCMMSAHDASDMQHGKQPQAQQRSLRATDKHTLWVVRCVWIVTSLIIIWLIIGWVLSSLFTGSVAGITGAELSLLIPTLPPVASIVVSTLIIGAFQTFITLALHSVEILVNRSRDETLWRHASHRPSIDDITTTTTTIATKHTVPHPRFSRVRTLGGAPERYNSLRATLTSWQSLLLFAFKPITHWLFCSTLVPLFIYPTSPPTPIMHVVFLLPLTCVFLLLAAFATFLAYHQPRGPIPATWGHLQTLADLVDDWGEGRGLRLFWGDKGVNADGTRHAGTSARANEVGEIDMVALYAGVDPGFVEENVESKCRTDAFGSASFGYRPRFQDSSLSKSALARRP